MLSAALKTGEELHELIEVRSGAYLGRMILFVFQISMVVIRNNVIMNNLTCFGPTTFAAGWAKELNEDIAWRIGRTYGELFKTENHRGTGGDVLQTSGR